MTWVWVSNGRPNEKYWLGKRKEKSLVFFTSKNGGRATFDSLLSFLHSPSALLCPDDRLDTAWQTRLWGHNHTGGACVCVCGCVCVVCVCVCVWCVRVCVRVFPSSGRTWMNVIITGVSRRVTARHSLIKTKRVSSGSAEEGLKKGCREKWEG